jgi:hypothetical protein
VRPKRDLKFELIDPGSVELNGLFRPMQQPDGDWEAPEPTFRDKRMAPAAGHRDRFAVLYTADTLECVAAACRILMADSDDNWTWDSRKAHQYDVVRYSLNAAALFLPLDHPNMRRLGLAGGQKSASVTEAQAVPSRAVTSP